MWFSYVSGQSGGRANGRANPPRAPSTLITLAMVCGADIDWGVAGGARRAPSIPRVRRHFGSLRARSFNLSYFFAGGRLRPAGRFSAGGEVIGKVLFWSWPTSSRQLSGATGCGAPKNDPPAGRGGRGRRGDRPRRRSQEIDAGLLGTRGCGSHIVAWSLHRPPPTCRRLGLGCSAKGRVGVQIRRW